MSAMSMMYRAGDVGGRIAGAGQSGTRGCVSEGFSSSSWSIRGETWSGSF